VGIAVPTTSEQVGIGERKFVTMFALISEAECVRAWHGLAARTQEGFSLVKTEVLLTFSEED
jgi:hypothetical protein